MTKTRRVWAIYYKVRSNSNDSWRRHEWVGPCGVGVTMREFSNSFVYNCLSYRPFFFRTRALARLRVEDLDAEKNQTWHWVKYTVRPLTLSWKELK